MSSNENIRSRSTGPKRLPAASSIAWCQQLEQQQLASVAPPNPNPSGFSVTREKGHQPAVVNNVPVPPPAQQKSEEMTLPRVPPVWNVEAQEFVPKARYAYPPQTYQPLDQEQQAFLQDFASFSIQDSGDYNHEPGVDSIVASFCNALQILIYSPGNMKEYLMPICDMILNGRGVNLDKLLNNMVEELFEQSISNPNFRYTGARICQFLISNLKTNPTFGNFHKALSRRCEKDYDKRKELIGGSDSDRDRLRGLAMFMAELYLNVQVENDGGSVQHLDDMPSNLTDVIHTLLSHPTEQEVKCCCQLLKLCGALLEDVAKNEPTLCDQFEKIFTTLASLTSTDGLSRNTQILVGTVISLKEKNWNRMIPSPPKKSGFSYQPDPPLYQPEAFHQEPTFFSQSGETFHQDDVDDEDWTEAHILTEEEEVDFCQFQAESGAEMFRHMADSDPNYNLWMALLSEENPDDGGMGEEEEAAFEEFLQNHCNSHYSQVSQSQMMSNQLPQHSAPAPYYSMMPPYQPPVHSGPHGQQYNPAMMSAGGMPPQQPYHMPYQMPQQQYSYPPGHQQPPPHQHQQQHQHHHHQQQHHHHQQQHQQQYHHQGPPPHYYNNHHRQHPPQ